MATTAFRATTVKHYEEDEVKVLALGDDPAAPERFLIIARLDEDEHATVDDGIGLQTSESDYEAAHAISAVKLVGNRLQVQVKEAFVVHFGASTIEADIAGDAETVATHLAVIRRALEVIFEGSAVLPSVDRARV